MPVRNHHTPTKLQPVNLNPIRLRPARIEIPVTTTVGLAISDLLIVIMQEASHDRSVAVQLEGCYNMTRFDWGLPLVKPQFRGRWER